MVESEAYMYLEEQGWHYDNAWKYKDEPWNSYVRNDSLRIRILEQYPKFLIIRNPGHNGGEEVWNGTIGSLNSLEQMVSIADAALEGES